MKLKLGGHQGDVCIFEVEGKVTEETVESAQTKNAILAYGEASGHAHQFEELDSVHVRGFKKYPGLFLIEPKVDAKLVHGRARDFKGKEADHDYHGPAIFREGKKYITGIVEETDWISKQIRRVID